jgi:DNA-directed RNA polymerase specialized sigma subunit
MRRIKLSQVTINKILELAHKENLEPHEIAKMLDISERDVVSVLHPQW